ncbi:hypothetical protein [Oricola sp.]|uniref:hypothetical protein n=1 Tax=Oricola sp. TaxID=1979950 RepID=UPI0025E8C128|nr:hypothetical protein [Oricola sp.]MCI5078209.1 hypothetical protein [Oricola sp.]
MLPIFKLILLIVLAGIVLVGVLLATEPMYLMAALAFNPASLVIVLGLSVAICVALRVASWLRTLAVVIGLSALFVATAAAVTFVPRPCQRLAAIAADPGSIDPFRVTHVVMSPPQPHEDTRIQRIDPGSELIEDRTSGTHPQATGRYAKVLHVRKRVSFFGIDGTDATAHPDCVYVAESEGVLYGTAEQRHRGVPGLADNQHCLSDAEQELLLHGMRYTVTEVDSARAGRIGFIAKAFDTKRRDLQATVVFFMNQPRWYGYPFSAFVPMSCASHEVRWDKSPNLGLQPMPPRAPALALMAGLEAIYGK